MSLHELVEKRVNVLHKCALVSQIVLQKARLERVQLDISESASDVGTHLGRGTNHRDELFFGLLWNGDL